MSKYRVFDGHCDTPAELWRNGASLRENRLAVSLARAKNCSGYAQFFAFCTAWMQNGVPHSTDYRRAYRYFLAQLEENRDAVSLCRTADEAERAIKDEKCAAFLSIEGAEAVDCDLGRLDEAYEQGVRMISLVWNIENPLSGSCVTGNGLSAQGKEFFRRAQRLGMLVDVSHLSERGFWDMADLAEKPIVASHSNSAAICPHVRNLTDEQFRAVCDLGGTVGLNLVGSFLSPSGHADFEDFHRHLAHFYDLGGEGHVALGLDLDGTDELPQGFCGVQNYPNLAEYLIGRGYTDEMLQGLFSGALMEVVRNVLH